MTRPLNKTHLCDYAQVLMRAHNNPFTTKSDFARAYANFIALAACDGNITTKVGQFVPTATWRITEKGLRYLYFLLPEVNEAHLIVGYDLNVDVNENMEDGDDE